MCIKEHRKQYTLKLLTEVLGVSASGYQKWLRSKLSSRARENQRILERIIYHYRRSHCTYGMPRILAAIRKEGLRVSKKRITRLMKKNNIRAKMSRKFKVTTKQSSGALASENLINQNFSATHKNQIWTSDITYLWTKEGWLYLAVVMDLYSRKIVGWSIDCSLSTELVIKALMMAILHRNPSS